MEDKQLNLFEEPKGVTIWELKRTLEQKLKSSTGTQQQLEAYRNALRSINLMIECWEEQNESRISD